jgi:hypothetical protein
MIPAQNQQLLRQRNQVIWQRNLPRPLSVLKFWEKGGRTPSKMVFFRRSEA